MLICVSKKTCRGKSLNKLLFTIRKNISTDRLKKQFGADILTNRLILYTRENFDMFKQK